jgi:hypothetical protein
MGICEREFGHHDSRGTTWDKYLCDEACHSAAGLELAML